MVRICLDILSVAEHVATVKKHLDAKEAKIRGMYSSEKVQVLGRPGEAQMEHGMAPPSTRNALVGDSGAR